MKQDIFQQNTSSGHYNTKMMTVKQGYPAKRALSAMRKHGG